MQPRCHLALIASKKKNIYFSRASEWGLHGQKKKPTSISGLFSFSFHEAAGKWCDTASSWRRSFQPPSQSHGRWVRSRTAQIDRLDRLTHWRCCWGRILREIKMSNVPELHFTPSNRRRPRETLLVALIEWLICRGDLDQHFYHQGSVRTEQADSISLQTLGLHFDPGHQKK